MTGRLVRTLAAALLAPLGAALALAACGGGATAACTAGGAHHGGVGGCAPAARRAQVATTVRSGDLTVTLAVAPAPAKAGAAVQIEVAARAQRAPGALGFVLRYGDGATSGSGPVPQFCIAGASRPARRVWRLRHRYGASGRYAVSVRVYVNCTSDHVTARAALLVN